MSISDTQIGQIIYNVEDYSSSGGLISTSAQNLNTIISSQDNGYEKNKINIYENIFDLDGFLNGKIIYKIGIQAPQGTIFYLSNQDQEEISQSEFNSFMIGKTGIYELDSNIPINFLAFKKPKNYILNEQRTDEKIKNGIIMMEKAIIEYNNNYQQLKLSFESSFESDSNEMFWSQHDIIYQKFLKEYAEGRTEYLNGISGVYEIQEGNDLHNIIIDFYYKTNME